MPRPRTHLHAARTRAITVRVTPSEYARLQAEAAQAGASVSGLAERYITRGTVRVEASRMPAPLDPALIAELKRIGNNLNQIAHALNSNLPPDTTFTARSLRDLIHTLMRDELLLQRLRDAKERGDDSAPASPRQEFQRVVSVRPARSERPNS